MIRGRGGYEKRIFINQKVRESNSGSKAYKEYLEGKPRELDMVAKRGRRKSAGKKETCRLKRKKGRHGCATGEKNVSSKNAATGRRVQDVSTRDRQLAKDAKRAGEPNRVEEQTNK